MRYNFILLFISLVISLAAAELLVRFTGAAPEVAPIEKWRMRLAANPRIGYEPIPNVGSRTVPTRFFGYRGSSNSLGFRDNEFSLEKAPNSYRIIVLGDSIPVGLWIDDDNEIFPNRLEGALTANSVKKVEVLNFAVAGYNTQQEVETLIDKGLVYKPDLVILSYCLNDRERDDGNIYALLLEQELKGGRVSPHRISSRLLKSALFRFLYFKVYDPKKRKLFSEQGADFMRLKKDKVEEYFIKLAEVSKTNNFKVMIAAFPDFTDLKSYSYFPEHDKIRNISEVNNFHYLDLLTAFRKCENSAPKKVSFDRYHPSPFGHACAANAIAEFLLKKSVIPK